MMAANQPTEEFIHDVLTLHNKYRSIHSSPNLEIQDKLSELAQDWAEELAKKDIMEHRPNNNYGENIYLGSSSDPEWRVEPEKVVDAWYAEIENYKFGDDSPENLADVGHFTQLIWHSTKTMGLGMATSATGKVIVVCNYDPPGNILLQFPNNVYPVKESNNTENSAGDFVNEVLGIPIEMPKVETLESMARLYAVPSEKIRVLTSWLIKVTEEADAWQSWVRSHIDLILRMSEYLIQAQEQLRPSSSDNPIENSSSNSIGTPKMVIESSMEKLEDANVSAGDSREPLQVGGDSLSEIDRTLEGKNNKLENVEIFPEPVDGEEKAADKQPEEESEHPVENNATDSEVSSSELSKKEVQNSWPIGVPWSPRVLKNDHKKNNVKNENFEDKFEVIPLPRNKEEMENLIKQVTYQATIYLSLYKHWKETLDRAYKEIMDRDIMPTEETFNDDEIPYSFYVYTEPDIGIANDHKEEEINSSIDTGREQINHHHERLYFNISDKTDNL